MDAKFKDSLKNTCHLEKDYLAPIPGRYIFNGPSIYGLIYLQIPTDCQCIEISRMCCEKNCGELYPVDSVLSSTELDEVTDYMKHLGFMFSRGSKRLDQMASCFSGIVIEGRLVDRMHVYYYFYKYEYLRQAETMKIAQ